jgi:glycerophosphoryl diester phosphodiesterase
MLPANKLIAHRGASAYAPENTLAAFDKAYALGSTFIEFDVMCSEDGEPFIFHDEDLKRTSNGRGCLGRMSASYLDTLDAGAWFSRRFKGEKIPHLKTIIEWLADKPIQANIEIKPFSFAIEQTVVAVLSHLHQYWPKDKALPLLSSFTQEALQLCRSIYPEIPLGFLMDSWDESWQKKAQELGCYSIHCHRRILTLTRAKMIKDAGFMLCAYTVNSKRQFKKLLGMGVDAVFSDYPDL